MSISVIWKIRNGSVIGRKKVREAGERDGDRVKSLCKESGLEVPRSGSRRRYSR
jgi:hypothetical protein